MLNHILTNLPTHTASVAGPLKFVAASAACVAVFALKHILEYRFFDSKNREVLNAELTRPSLERQEYYAVISGRTPAGDYVEIKRGPFADERKIFETYGPVGTNIPVAYDPENPKHATLLSERDDKIKYVSSAVLLVLSVALAAFAGSLVSRA